MADLNKPARKIAFDRRPRRKIPECDAGLTTVTLVGVDVACPFKPDEEKLVYDFEVEGFPHEEHGTLQVFGQADGSCGEKSNNLKIVEAFELVAEDGEVTEFEFADLVGLQCQAIVAFKPGSKGGDKKFPRITELLPLSKKSKKGKGK
jgi:hypothetical protein